MIRKWLGISLMVLVGASFFAVSSCGRSQQLQSISITPTSVTFLSPGTTITFQLKAYGTYIHPPATKDITGQVTWSAQSSDLVTLTSAGVISTSGLGYCGVTNVTATLSNPGGPSGNVVVGTTTATVVNTAISVCPQ